MPLSKIFHFNSYFATFFPSTLFTITGCRGAVARRSFFRLLSFTVACGSFLRLFSTIACGSFFCCLRAITRSRCFLFYLGANCTLFSTASATGGWSSLFLAASAAGSHSGAAHAGYEAGNTEPGQHFLQVFLFHCSLLFLRLIIKTGSTFFAASILL